ncbi:MAG: response regulator, partial [Anaerolineales bacterium]|nr:response regulator [Anaerolineales bacterium]
MQTILVVDDEPEIIRVSRGYLERAGYRVISAADGTSAMAAFNREGPDLVVLDLNLPSLSGNKPMDG